MKSLRFTLALVTIIIWNAAIFSQNRDQAVRSDPKSETLKVGGKCDMCKARIERAAKIEGVEAATWNKDTKLLTIVYDPGKVTKHSIQKNIALAGHDTESFKAEDKVYESLPACCKYERIKP
jgi:copper chaperone CopZ